MGNSHYDMHLHTWFSDGVMSPRQVVEWALRHDVTTIAITDHDGTEGIREGIRAGKEIGVCVYPGIEISSCFNDGTMPDFLTGKKSVLAGGTEEKIWDGPGLHILGYGIDPDNEALAEALADIRIKRQDRNERMLRALADLGYDVPMEELIVRPGQTFIGKPNIARVMVERGYISHINVAFNDVFARDEIRAIKKEKVSARRGIELIRGAGGHAVLAHPGIIRHIGNNESDQFYENLEKILDQLIEWGLEGLECDYPQHSEIEKQAFREMALARGLRITRGSDFHGDDSHEVFPEEKE